jgi:malonate decarboxylase epsilon subunit
MASNIAHVVRWHDATTVLKELGCLLFIEMPPGRVLSELAKDAFPEVKSLAASEGSLTHTLRVAGRYSSDVD